MAKFRPSLRVRITGAAVTVFTVALAAGGFLFISQLQSTLTAAVQVTAEQDAEELANRIESVGLPTEEEEDGDDERFFQVVTESGDVVAASENSPAEAIDAPDQESWRISLPEEDADYLAVADEDEDLTIITGRSLEDVSDTLGTVGQLLGIAGSLLIALVALTTWLVVGRALRPVEQMRREVDEVTVANLDHRVADPGTSDEIGRLARTMNLMMARLEESQQAQRRFISDASHELKSPLASLRQCAEVARTHPDRVDAAELSDAVLDEGARLERLVQGMLVLARADEQAFSILSKAVDLDDLVLAEVSRLRTTGLAVDASAVGPARVLGDGGLLGQAIRNLVDNAARHAAARVAFGLAEADGTAVLSVEDDGDGVPPADRERVFERFVRLDDARARNSGGSGLGLAIVREIIRTHGGSILVTDGALGGARFEVRLPAGSEPPVSSH